AVHSVRKGEMLYFYMDEWSDEYANGVVYFAINEDYDQATFYYSFTNGIGWFEVHEGTTKRIVLTTAGFNANGNSPDEADEIDDYDDTVYNPNYGIDFVQQISESAIITRAAPTLTLNIVNGQNLTSSFAEFTAEYSQAQDEPVKWVRWELADAKDKSKHIADTNNIYTSVLAYEVDGLFNNTEYALKCTVETENGVQVSSGWVNFSVKYTANSYTGNFTADYYRSENSVGLAWDVLENAVIIPGKASGAYTLANGAVTLPANSTITWNQVTDNAMNFAGPWAILWKGKVTTLTPKGTFLNINNGRITASRISPTIKYTFLNSEEDLSVGQLLYDRTRAEFEPQNPPPQSGDLCVSEAGFICEINEQWDDEEFTGYYLRVVDKANDYSDVTGNFIAVNIINPNGTVSQTELNIASEDSEIVLLIAPGVIYAFSYKDGKLLDYTREYAYYTQETITSVSVSGGESGSVCDCISIIQGNVGNIMWEHLHAASGATFEPSWNSTEYQLYMTANFTYNIEGGVGTATTNRGFRVYRQEEGNSELKVIAKTNSLTTKIKDFGIVSGKQYLYHLFAYDNNGAFMSSVTSDKTINIKFKNYSLLVTEYNEDDEAYHVIKQYIFENNISHGSVSNNNSPSLTANFTRYPVRMGSVQNYASGTLQALIGIIDKDWSYDYYDSIELEQELNELSTSNYILFMRDMKGHLRMVHTSGAITQDTEHKTRQMQNKISLPWVEVGDASEATVIQLSTDVGWRVDEDVLDVEFDVDFETGKLIAKYPLPYEGTTFSLTGADKSILTAKTPKSISMPTFELPAEGEQDEGKQGVLTVKVTKNVADED
ncbi:MAG: hypothetical protein NC311_17095, partial [Muribaculaceae bacterium]|nr:hypothetical protein [Muribaculaceae bacterium]